MPGGGSLVAALETASGRCPDAVAGKPSDFLVDLFRHLIGDTSRTCMIGDRLDTDIEFGNKAGFSTLLVLTGITNEEGALAAEGLLKPEYYIDSVTSLTDFF